MAKLGQDLLEWQTEQLVQWLQQEEMNDCVATFTLKRINGRSLVNLTEAEIKSLPRISHESKKKLIKAIEKFKRKKKEKMAAMFGGQQPVQTNTRKPPSFCQEDDAGSDDEGWGTDEWDSEGSQDASSESDGGEYLEPEEDFSKAGSPGRDAVSSVPTGLVAQLRAGIASSLSRPHNVAMVVGYGQVHGFDLYQHTITVSCNMKALKNHFWKINLKDTNNKAMAPQDGYEDEDIYDEPPEELYDEPSDSSGGAVVVRPPKRPPKQEDRGEYLLPREMEGDQELYETPLKEEDESPKPPARPIKSNRFIPTKVAQGNKFVPVNNPVNNNNNNDNGEVYDIPDLEEHDEEEDSYEIPGEQTVPPPRPPKGSIAQPTPAVKPTLQAKPFPTGQKPKVLPGKPSFKGRPLQPSSQPQGAPARFARPQQSSLSPQGTPFRAQPPQPVQTDSRQPFGRTTSSPPKTVNPGGPFKSHGGSEKSLPPSPVKSAGESIGPGPGPKPVPRAGILNKTDSPKTRPEAPSPSPRGPPLPPATHRRQAPLPEPKDLPVGESSLPSVPPPQKTEAVPPRPPKAGQSAGNQPALPRKHPGERPGVPLPAPPATNSRDLREQSSASSIESTSADEPIISLQHLPKPGKRSLPALPPMQSKSPIDMMKEAPWFQGPVDRKTVEASLKKSNQNGAFLVRNSTKSPNDYSMSLIFNGNVRHLRIPHKNNKYVLGDSGIQQFDTIIELVNHYRQNEVDLKTGGKTKLTVSCQVYQS